MSVRELVVLGTASQVPTRHRNHNGYALRWDDRLVFFDPGEGFQRQCSIAGLAIARADAVCLTHFHGDHCLGLPGLIARRGLDRCPEALTLWFPADGVGYYDKLRSCTASATEPRLDPQPIAEDGIVGRVGDLTVTARALRHRVTTYGYRLQEPDDVSFDPTELAARGLAGPDVGRLRTEGSLETDRGVVTLEDVSTPRPGQSMAFVMDTAVCDAIVDLARGVDLLVIESTFLDVDAGLAEQYLHLTARDAARLATEAGVRRVVLTHFSQRYADINAFAAEASAHHPDVHIARDFDVIPVPKRS